MDFVKLLLNVDYGHYSYKNSSSVAMDILGCFLKTDVGCCTSSNFSQSWQDWAWDDLSDIASGNITRLEKEGLFIYLRDLYSDEEIPTKMPILCSQFVRLLDEWKEKVCKKMPKEIIIKHDNGEFWIETKD